jgi:hypothetical protein
MARKLWTDDELRVAIALSYCRPWKEFTDGHDLCIEIASILSRTPTSLERQVRNARKLHRVPTKCWDEVIGGDKKKFSSGIGESCKKVVRLYRGDPVKLIIKVHGMSSRVFQPIKEHLPSPQKLFSKPFGDGDTSVIKDPLIPSRPQFSEYLDAVLYAMIWANPGLGLMGLEAKEEQWSHTAHSTGVEVDRLFARMRTIYACAFGLELGGLDVAVLRKQAVPGCLLGDKPGESLKGKSDRDVLIDWAKKAQEEYRWGLAPYFL